MKMFIEGSGVVTIARYLQKQKILTPVEYAKANGRYQTWETLGNCYRCSATVSKILSQQEYVGDTVNFRFRKPSYKSKRQVKNDESDLVIFPNTHEPIIEREQYEAEAILNKLIKADKEEDIKIVYANLGQSNEYYHYYMLGGIVFINDRATYIYSNCFGLYGDMVVEDTPENIKNLLEICSSKMYNNRNGYKGIKRLFDYDFVMTLIEIYEEYALY